MGVEQGGPTAEEIINQSKPIESSHNVIEEKRELTPEDMVTIETGLKNMEEMAQALLAQIAFMRKDFNLAKDNGKQISADTINNFKNYGEFGKKSLGFEQEIRDFRSLGYELHTKNQ